MAIVKYNKKSKETSNVSVRDMNSSVWKALRKMAMLEDKSMAVYLEGIIKERVENFNKRG